MTETEIKDLLPKLIDKTDRSYVAVQKLGAVLHKTLISEERKNPPGRRIKNIAITGPYGSGKSSIIQTLERDYPMFNYLNLSLATLRADGTSTKFSDSKNVENDTAEVSIHANKSEEHKDYTSQDQQYEILNRRIEYSILQQIIYKEETKKVPNSRLRRIRHFDRKELKIYGISVIVFLLCFFIVFEPAWFRVETFYSIFNFGSFNVLFDLICVIIMTVEFYFLIRKLIQAYSNSKLNKLNLKDGEIELKETSIFNKHLDEILYFFQVTPYNVVVIEDVDRFGTTDIFLKLRELNQLINESNVIKRPVVFLYAVKDDLFKDEDRVKFFDYLITVIPTINPSNSKDILKSELAERGYVNFSDDDISEIGFFIQDKRLLVNIVNEYDQYHQRLVKENDNLDCTKLLGMIVYKNFFPRDFAQLHRREGMVYKFMSLKDKFITYALNDINKREKEIEELLESSKRDSHLKIEELRSFFIEVLCRHLQGSKVNTIKLENHSYAPSEIINNDEIFGNLLKQKTLNYNYSNYNSNYNYNRTDSIDVNALYIESGFEKRLRALELHLDQERYLSIKRNIQSERLGISSQRIASILEKYSIAETDEYKNLNLPPLIDVFIRRGYINEDYYDYISYFYEGMISISDRDILIDIKRQKKGDYLKHIDHIDNFTKELKYHNFTSDAILYVELLDYLIVSETNPNKDFLLLFYKRINRKQAPLSFLSTYYLKGKHPSEVFSKFISSNTLSSWSQVQKHPNTSERESLLCAWLKYTEYPVNGGIQQWINQNYSFIAQNSDEIGEDIIIKICENSEFEKLENGNSLVLSVAVKHRSYALNSNNIGVIIAFLDNGDFDDSNITLTKIRTTQNQDFIEFIEDNIIEVFPLFSIANKTENVESLTWLLNQDNLNEAALDQYLEGQTNPLPSLENIKQERWHLILKNYLIHPSWDALQQYMSFIGRFDEYLFNYIDKFAKQLGDISFGSDDDMESMFFREIFLNSNISSKSIQWLTRVFSGNSFNGDNELANLDSERLQWFLNNNMLLFTENNSQILKGTEIFADYLIKYKIDFLENITQEYLKNPKVVITLLDSLKLKDEERSIIIKNIPDSLVFNNQSLANRVVRYISKYDQLENSPSYYISLLQIAAINDDSIKVATSIIDNEVFDLEVCNNILKALGEPYSDLTDASKNPKFKLTTLNKRLLEAVKSRRIITSYKPYKEDQIRAFHGRK